MPKVKILGPICGKGTWVYFKSIANPFGAFGKCIMDTHPRVRIRAAVSGSQLNSANALGVAIKALAKADKFIEYSFTQSLHALVPNWKQAFLNNTLNLQAD